MNDFEKRAYGCIIGAFIGDSIGSYLEFKNVVPKHLLDTSLKMPGGGIYQVAPGQVTDDSELALMLAYGLIEGNGRFDDDLIAKHYSFWYNSSPFDIGTTTRKAMGPLMLAHLRGPNYSWKYFNEEVKDCKGWANKMRNAAFSFNSASQSNGCLMRSTPLAVWCSKLESEKEIEEIVTKEVSLTHYDETVQIACFLYVLAIKKLLNSGDPDTTYTDMGLFIFQNYGKSAIYKEWWLPHVVLDEILTTTSNIGWLKIAWTHAFYYLKHNKKYSYSDVIKDIISKGGDTDTNAAIVGGLIGAAKGVEGIPKYWSDQVLNCDFSKGSQPRDDKFNPRHLRTLIPNLISIAPSSLKHWTGSIKSIRYSKEFKAELDLPKEAADDYSEDSTIKKTHLKTEAPKEIQEPGKFHVLSEKVASNNEYSVENRIFYLADDELKPKSIFIYSFNDEFEKSGLIDYIKNNYEVRKFALLFCDSFEELKRNMLTKPKDYLKSDCMLLINQDSFIEIIRNTIESKIPFLSFPSQVLIWIEKAKNTEVQETCVNFGIKNSIIANLDYDVKVHLHSFLKNVKL